MPENIERYSKIRREAFKSDSPLKYTTMDSTNEGKKTMEERLKEKFEVGIVDTGGGRMTAVIYANRYEMKSFINQELQSLVADILGKKKAHHVRIEDVLQIAKERGVELRDMK